MRLSVPVECAREGESEIHVYMKCMHTIWSQASCFKLKPRIYFQNTRYTVSLNRSQRIPNNPNHQQHAQSAIWGSFNYKTVRIFRPFLSIALQNILAKLVFQLGHSAPKLFAQILYSTIMRVAKWERDLWWISLFCKSVKWEQIWTFSYWQTPLLSNEIQKYVVNTTINRHHFTPIKIQSHT